MAEFKSELAVVNYDIATVYEKAVNPQLIQGMLSSVPAEAMAKIDKIEADTDSVKFALNGLPEITLRRTEAIAPNKVTYSAENSPMAFSLSMNLSQVEDSKTGIEVVINVDVPIFLKPMISGPINSALKQFGERISKISFS